MKAILRAAGARALEALPHDAARRVLAALAPGDYARLQALRHGRDGDPGEPVLAPFDRHRCIFVHIPKCAGMSIAQSLFGRYVTGHMPLRTYRYVYSSGELRAYYKFTFVRNPYDRLVSAFLFMQRGGMHEADRRWASEHVQGYRDFEEFVLRGLPRPEVRRYFHFTPQLDFVTLPRLRGPQVDFIGRFETLDRDFPAVAGRLGLTAALAGPEPGPAGTPLPGLLQRGQPAAGRAVLRDGPRGLRLPVLIRFRRPFFLPGPAVSR